VQPAGFHFILNSGSVVFGDAEDPEPASGVHWGEALGGGYGGWLRSTEETEEGEEEESGLRLVFGDDDDEGEKEEEGFRLVFNEDGEDGSEEGDDEDEDEGDGDGDEEEEEYSDDVTEEGAEAGEEDEYDGEYDEMEEEGEGWEDTEEEGEEDTASGSSGADGDDGEEWAEWEAWGEEATEDPGAGRRGWVRSPSVSTLRDPGPWCVARRWPSRAVETIWRALLSTIFIPSNSTPQIIPNPQARTVGWTLD